MNILFVNPPRNYEQNSPIALPALGLPILARIMNDAGHKSEVIDLGAIGKRISDVKNLHKYDWIGFTTLTANREGVQQCIDDLWTDHYNGQIAAGGIYATLFPDEVYNWGVDLVVKGECEGNIQRLIEDGAAGIREGEPIAIEDVPAPDWNHHTPMIDKYHGNVSIIRPRPGITQWTRGCPYSCIFCENKIYNHQPTRYRPPEKIADEMLYLFTNGMKNVFIYDDETFGTKTPDGWMREIADKIESMRFNLVTQARCSKKYITHELMTDAKRAGINTIFWGVESLSDKVLDAINKQIALDDIWHTLTVAKSAGIKNALYIQVGNYMETEVEAKETNRRLIELHSAGLIDYLQVFVTQVNPGTELEQIARKAGWYQKAPPGWNKMKEVIGNGTPWMSREAIYYWQSRHKAAVQVEAL